MKSIDDRSNAEAKRTSTWVIPIVLPLLCGVSLSLSDAEAFCRSIVFQEGRRKDEKSLRRVLVGGVVL